MTTETVTVREGWTWLINSRKWHYFSSVDNQSLCRGYMLLRLPADLEPDTGPTSDDCAGCRKKLDKRVKS